MILAPIKAMPTPIALSPVHQAPEEETLADTYRRVPLQCLSTVVDSLGTRFEGLAVQRACDILRVGSPQASARARLLQRDSLPRSLDVRLVDLARRQRQEGAAAVADERQALRADLDAFAATRSTPSGLRFWDPEIRAERHRARFQQNNEINLRLMRRATEQMRACGDLSDSDIVDNDGMSIVRLSQVAVGEMVFESMGGTAAGGSSTFVVVSMPAMRQRIADTNNPLLSHQTVGLRLSEAVDGMSGLDAAGRLRLRDATYARLMCRSLPTLQIGATAAVEAAIPRAAERLAREIVSLTMQVPMELNKLAYEVFSELRSNLPAAVASQDACIG